MQIQNKFDAKLVKTILERENEFISNIFDILPVPVSAIQRDFYEDEIVTMSTKKGNRLPSISNPKTRVKSLEELQNRLLELKKNKTLNYKEKLLKKGLKNRIKKKEKKMNYNLKRKSLKNSQKLENGAESNDKSEDETKIKPTKPIFNSQGKMVFSKFDFSEMGTKNKAKSKNKNDPQKILKDLQAKTEKLKELESGGEKEKAEEMKKKFIWNSALAKADGQKVKDDPELLKKSIKRREQEVNKSKNKWKARQEGVQKAKDERQNKRTENINKRKKDKKMNKLKKAAKRGKIIPGL